MKINELRALTTARFGRKIVARGESVYKASFCACGFAFGVAFSFARDKAFDCVHENASSSKET